MREIKTRYDLEQFIDKQNKKLEDVLKPLGLIPSITTVTPTWKPQKREPKYYYAKDLTSLKLTIEFVKY
ncbi:MAG: hypothetical protein M0R06_11495 [Sphaerochaeta sp.]|jgi:hypothetical protein|nr:hypothetical protein [Sphaerochaeta sp.]